MEKTLGGDRLGSGKKMKVQLHNFERSTHNMGYLWRSTMAAGTLVPFLKELALPGDTFDIDLDCDIKTHPTIGPLFGSYKVQLDVFQCPVRLYQGALHNNKLGIGMNMSQIKLPTLTLKAKYQEEAPADPDNNQINSSCLLKYLGIRGIGSNFQDGDPATRTFNAVPLLAYWDIYKQYYSNKMEEIGAVIHGDTGTGAKTITTIDVQWSTDADTLNQYPTQSFISVFDTSFFFAINYTGTAPSVDKIIITTDIGDFTIEELCNYIIDNGSGQITAYINYSEFGDMMLRNWRYSDQGSSVITTAPRVQTFDLSEIDDMREAILAAAASPTAFDVNAQNLAPYKYLLDWTTTTLPSPYSLTQEGLGLKTYQSDLFNNWLKTEWIDGPGGITEVTAIDTSGGSFSIDTLNLSKKVYNMLNRIAVSGGTYDDWMDAVYTHERHMRAESPIYCGGLIKELVFQEVVSNTEAETSKGTQPLGTLAGKGVMANKHKGGKVTIKVDEPSYLMGIVSLTPRVDYSQGNKWDVNLVTVDDFHKPDLDEIGFQELIQEQMAYWTTVWDGTKWVTKSAGKQPAWINYMTNVNQTYGNFAVADNEMFMTLNRKYEYDQNVPYDGEIVDLTTYIDPSKYNNIFAQTSLDAQNFWVQIAVDMTARRKMSAKLMPNL